MEALEDRRLKMLGKPADKLNGLIIPIIFRGAESLPKDLRERRQFYSFDNFLLSDARLGENPGYSAQIKKMAEYIASRFNALNALPSDPCESCDNFALPTDDEIRSWLEHIVPGRPPFVLREG